MPPATVSINGISRYTTLWRVIARDGYGVDVTSATRPITYDGVNYVPSTVSPSPEQLVENLDPSNMEVTLSMATAGVTKQDLLGGRWDGARVEIRHYDWANAEVEQTWRGVLHSVVYDNGKMKAEVLDVALIFSQLVGNLYQDTCRADFGDAACGKTPATQTATVTGFVGREEFTVTLTEPEANFYQNGKVTFTSGANNGLSKEVRLSSQSGATLTVELLDAMRYAIAIGDAVTLYEGCAHTFPACIKKGNAKRFRGEPNLPGRNKLFRWPN